MEGNKNIFLAGDDALWYLAEPMHKKYSIYFADLMTDVSILPASPPCAHMYTLRVPPPFAYVILLIWYSPSPVLTLLVRHSFLILFYLRNSEIYGSC